MKWSICVQIRTTALRFVIQRFSKVNKGNLFAAFDVVEDDDAIIVQVNAVDKGVDDVAAELRIKEVAGAEATEPCPHFFFGETNLTGDPQLDQLIFHGRFLRFQGFHLLIDALMGYLRSIYQGIDQLIQLPLVLLDGLFVFLYPAACKFLVVFRDDGLCNIPHTGRSEDILQGLFHNIPFDEVLLLVLLPAGVLLLPGGAGVIIIIVTITAPAALADHVGAAVTTERFALQQILNLCFVGCRGVGIGLDDDLYLVEGVLVYQGFGNAGNQFALVHEIADIDGICQGAGEGGVGQLTAARAADAATFQLVDDLLRGDTLGVLLKYIANDRRGLFVRHQFSIHCLVAIRDRPATPTALCDGFTLAAKDLFLEIEGIILGGRFKEGFQEN